MENKKKKQLLAGGLLLVGGIALFKLMGMSPDPAPTTVAVAPVVEEVEHEFVLISTEDIPRGSRLTEAALEWQQWPAESVAESFIIKEARPQATTELVDSVVRADIYAGEPVIDAKIVRAGESGLMAALLAPGMRAVTTRVSTDSAAGGFIMPGDKVDIIATRQLPRMNNTSGQQAATNVTEYAATTIFTNVKVLAMNQNFTNGPDAPAAIATVSFATFELNQRDAERLEEAAETGTISLTLRGMTGGGMGRSAASSPKVQAKESSTMVVYRNGRQTQVAVRGQ